MQSHIEVSHKGTYTTGAIRLRQQQMGTGAAAQRWRKAYCQRFFTNGGKSSYFEVGGTAGISLFPEQTEKEQTEKGPAGYRKVVAYARAELQTDVRGDIIAVEEHAESEPNPLLEWAGWDRYLKGFEWADLVAMTERPDPAEEPAEEVALGIWTAMEEVAHTYHQRDGPRRGGVDAATGARIRHGETRFYALQAMSDHGNVVKYVRSWQNLMMFFARTQGWDAWQQRQRERLRQFNITSR